MKQIKTIVSIFLLVPVILVLFSFCGSSQKETAGTPGVIRVLHAGSLSIPFKEIAQAFMEKHPQYNVLLEAHGSRTCARQIIDLKRQVEVMASSDSEVIRNLLMPGYADFCIDFTTNEMVIMYTPKSRYADTIHADNWYEILLKPEVQYGHSDPNSDPCGYRALLAWQLAEKQYKIEGLYNRLTGKMPEKNIRPKEVDLIALLEAGELDYIFIYRSVAEQHQAKYIILPDEINLKSPEWASFYQAASLKITGGKPGEWVQIQGAPMLYGITMPKNAPNPEAGILFISFVLGKEGQEIMKRNGQPEIIPPLVDNREKLPEALKKFF
jgi:molybdate/tungstate transport system substrate-binding protein